MKWRPCTCARQLIQSVVCGLGMPPGVPDGAGDVVECEARVGDGQPQRHESLPVVEELHLVGARRVDAAPRLGPAAARQVLQRTARKTNRAP